MEKKNLKVLIVNDKDLNCNCDKTTLEGMTISDLNFIWSDIEIFDVIVYEGSRGTKILRSKHFSSGVVK